MNAAYALFLSLFLLLSGAPNQHLVGDYRNGVNSVGYDLETPTNLKNYKAKFKITSSESSNLQHEDFLFSDSDDNSDSNSTATARFVVLCAFNLFIFAVCSSKNKVLPLSEFLLHLSSCKYLMFRVFRI